MKLPDFALGPLELERLVKDEPASTAAWARVAIGAEDFLLRLCTGKYGESMLFFRVDFPNSPVICVRDEYLFAARELIELLRQTDVELPSLFGEFRFTLWEQKLPELFRQTLADFNWERLHLLSDLNAETKIIIEGFEAATFALRYFPEDVESSFSLAEIQSSDCHDSTSMTQAQLFRQITLWMKEPMNDYALAYMWSRAPRRQIIPLLLTFKNGNWNDYIRMLELSILKHQEQEAGLYFLDFGAETKIENAFPPMMRKGIQIIHNYFSPSVNTNWKGAMKIYTQETGDGFRYELSVCRCTSAHQLLESQLELRDFLRDKLTPTELAGLMRA